MKSKNRIGWIALILLAYVVVVWLIYRVERTQADGNIHSITDAFWYSLVTLTTVGYGDFYPVTAAGRLLSLFFVLGSLGLLGILIGNITERFNTYQANKKMGYNGTDFTGHIIIAGWDPFARAITSQLIYAKKQVAIITEVKDHIDLIYEEFDKEDVFVLFSDPTTTSMIEKVNPQEAALAFINLPQDTEKLITILNLKKEYPEMKFMVILDNTDLKYTFSSAGVSYILSKNEIAAKLVASFIFEPDVASFTADLISQAGGSPDSDYDIQQYLVTPDNPYRNKTFGEAFQGLKRDLNVILIGIARTENGQRVIHKIPKDSLTIQEDDHLLLVTSHASVAALESIFGINEGV